MADADPTQTQPLSPSGNVDGFHARDEHAWNEYLRTGVASSVDAVFDRIEGLITERRAQLSAHQVRKQGRRARSVGTRD